MEVLIDRQAAIDAVEKWFFDTTDLRQPKEVLCCLPSTQPEQSFDEWKKDFTEYVEMLNLPRDDFKGIIEYINEAPPAQLEKEATKRVLWSGWKGTRDTRYKCPNCEKPVRNDDIYCHRCGQRLMFPKISFTDYVPGEKQQTIVRWDDE